jgi:putative ABC transport system permease protein
MTAFYRALLHLLPARRRAKYGGEMATTFADLASATRRDEGPAAVGLLWMKEIAGLLRFSIRERFMSLTTRLGWRREHDPDRRPRVRSRSTLSTDLRMALRSVRARGWHSTFIVGLLGVAMAAMTVVFSAADAFVFRRAPYPDRDSLVVLQQTRPGDVPRSSQPGPVIVEWRRHQDLFAAVHADDIAASVHVTADGITDAVPARSVTPGLLEMLGATTLWGRPLMPEDIAPGARAVAVVAEDVARRVAGDPALAIGRVLRDSAGPFEIVGVVNEAFRFPTARERIWRPLDVARSPTSKSIVYYSYNTIARLADGVSFDDASRAVSARAPAVELTSPRPDPKRVVTLERFEATTGNSRISVIFTMLVGAAACLLFIACANVASLELAGAVRRTRAYAVQAALGASRFTLVKIGLLEGALLLVVSSAVAAALAWWGIALLTANLPPGIAQQLSNAIDLDARAVVFMIVTAAGVWLATTLPSVWRASRSNLADTLRHDPRVMLVSRSAAWSRQGLMAAQVAATVLLIIGALLFARTYALRIALDKGFDSRDIVVLEVFPAPDAPIRGTELDGAIRARLAAFPGLRSLAATSSPPPSTTGGINGLLTINDGPESSVRVFMATRSVDPAYFETLGLPFAAGTPFTADSPMEHVVVDETFARRFWPGGDAIGSRFNIQSAGYAGVNTFHIVAVTKFARFDRDRNERGDEVFPVYFRLRPERDPTLRFVGRLDDPARFPDLVSVVRSIAQRSMVRADFLDDRFARLEGDRRIAASVTAGFGLLALGVASAGIYAVMAFLVAGRLREIGIRLALGASPSRVSRATFGASLKFVAGGAVAGLAAAVAASRWVESQLYGVSATDAATYLLATTVVVLAALAATWFPARQAASVDPAVTLRAE